MSGLTFRTSTGSLFMLFGQINSGRFSDSPGRSKILSRFLTSSIRSLAAFESSRRSFRSMSLKGSLKDIEEDLGVIVRRGLPSADVRPERAGVGVTDREDWCWSKSAAAKISAEAMTRRSEDVYICSKTGKLGGHICLPQARKRTLTLLRTSLSARLFSTDARSSRKWSNTHS